MEYKNFENCSCCKKQMTEIVRLNEEGGETQTFTYVCVNPVCVLKMDLSKVKTWKKR